MEIKQDDHEKLRITLDIEPDDTDETLTNADAIDFYLTDTFGKGEGQITLHVETADIDVLDGSTFEFELSPSQTAELPPRRHYPEVTVTWNGEPSTTSLSPNVDVVRTAHSAGSQ